MEIKPIETVYNGYRFRSRLEARWAVFFDALGIKYEYESKGYEVDYGEHGTIKYLPDFYFPYWDVYGEVKPSKSKLYESEEKISCCIDYGSTPLSKGVLILGQIPYYKNWYEEGCDGMIMPHFAFFWHESGVNSGMATILKSEYGTPQLIAGDFGFDYLDTESAPKLPRIDPIPEELYFMSMVCGCEYKGFRWLLNDQEVKEASERLHKAFLKARQARFEHSEKPQL